MRSMVKLGSTVSLLAAAVMVHQFSTDRAWLHIISAVGIFVWFGLMVWLQSAWHHWRARRGRYLGHQRFSISPAGFTNCADGMLIPWDKVLGVERCEHSILIEVLLGKHTELRPIPLRALTPEEQSRLYDAARGWFEASLFEEDDKTTTIVHLGA